MQHSAMNPPRPPERLAISGDGDYRRPGPSVGEGDLMRMSLPSPWSFIGAAQGLGGNVYDFEWYEGGLWLAINNLGVDFLNSHRSCRYDGDYRTWIP